MLRPARGGIVMSAQEAAQGRQFVCTGILGLDDVLGGQLGDDGLVRGRLRGERLLIVGPPGSGKTIMALALMYKGLKEGSENACGLFLTTEQPVEYLIDSMAGLFMTDFGTLRSRRLELHDFPPYEPPFSSGPPPNDQEMIDSMIDRLRQKINDAPHPLRHIVLDGLTAMQAVLSSRAEARRLTHMLLARLSHPRDSFDLLVMTAEAPPGFSLRSSSDSERLRDSFDDYLFDTVITLDMIETQADRRLRTIEISKSRGRYARTGRHTFSIVSQAGLPRLIRSRAALEEIIASDTPLVIFPREPRSERPAETESAPPRLTKTRYLKTGIDGLDALLDRDQHRGLLQQSTTVLIGGPGTASSLLGLRYLAKGLEDNPQQPVLLVSFGRDREDFTTVAHNFPWLRTVMEQDPASFHFLYYRPVNLDQNRLFYEIRKEIQTYRIDRVLIDSISSLPLIDIATESSSDFLVTLIGLLKELHCTAMLSYASDRPPEPFSTPGKFLSSLADNVFILENELAPGGDMRKSLLVLKARGTNAISRKVEFNIGEELSVRLP
jgi:KaiC/GvpD/RAD55 family RecA-like ATPase